MTEVLVYVLLIVLDFQAPEPLRENGCLPPSACLSITASAVVQAAFVLPLRGRCRLLRRGFALIAEFYACFLKHVSAEFSSNSLASDYIYNVCRGANLPS